VSERRFFLQRDSPFQRGNVHEIELSLRIQKKRKNRSGRSLELY
jgi:hypothetical protein